jgi:Transposase DDE domain
VWIPLAARLTPANVSDVRVAPLLIEALPEEVRFVLGDKHYDAKDLRQICLAEGRFLVSPSARSGSIFGNGQVLVMRTVEVRADSLGQLVSPQQPIGLYHLALAMRTHFLGSIELSQGLFLGRRQLMILTPSPLFLTLWL